MVFDKTQWHKNYATEALQAVTDYVFLNLKLHRIHADYYAPNQGSAKMFEKAGFTVEGIYKDHFICEGRYVDSVRVGKVNAG